MATKVHYAKAPTLDITVRGLPWKVKYLTSKQMRRVYKHTQLLGLTDPAAQVIYVDYEQTQTTVLNTTFHELLHAWVAVLQGSRESTKGAVSEESAANCVGDGFVELMPYLQELLKMVATLTKEAK